VSSAQTVQDLEVFVSSQVESAEVFCVLARTFTAMSEAVTRDTLVALASRAATSLAAADGICLLPVRQERGLYTAGRDPRPMTLRVEDSSLGHMAAGMTDRATEVHEGTTGDFLLLPNGSVQPLATLLLIPLAPSSGWAAFGAFWSTPRQPSVATTHALEALAGGTGLALQAQLKEHELVRSGQRHRYLVAERQHRVRNILAFVRSIIRRTGETAESAEEFALHLETRIGALARTQGTLAHAGHTGVELEELVRAEMTATAIREDRLHISGPPIRLHAKGAETIAMALHELAINSVKFGALAVPQGRIAVNWQTDWTLSPPWLRLSWIETGVAIASLAPRRRGFGQELIERTLPYELKAKTQFTFSPGGLRCVIEAPLNERITHTGTLGKSQDQDGHGTSSTAP
jgi:two-component sensor histidine kinase